MLPVRVLLLGFKVPKTLCFSVVCISSSLLPSFLPFSVAFSLSFLWCTSHLLFLIFLVFLPSFILYCCGILISSFLSFFAFLPSFLLWNSDFFFLCLFAFLLPAFFLVEVFSSLLPCLFHISFFLSCGGIIIYFFLSNFLFAPTRGFHPQKNLNSFFFVGVGSFT